MDPYKANKVQNSLIYYRNGLKRVDLVLNICTVHFDTCDYTNHIIIRGDFYLKSQGQWHYRLRSKTSYVFGQI